MEKNLENLKEELEQSAKRMHEYKELGMEEQEILEHSNFNKIATKISEIETRIEKKNILEEKLRKSARRMAEYKKAGMYEQEAAEHAFYNQVANEIEKIENALTSEERIELEEKLRKSAKRMAEYKNSGMYEQEVQEHEYYNEIVKKLSYGNSATIVPDIKRDDKKSENQEAESKKVETKKVEDPKNESKKAEKMTEKIKSAIEEESKQASKDEVNLYSTELKEILSEVKAPKIETIRLDVSTGFLEMNIKNKETGFEEKAIGTLIGVKEGKKSDKSLRKKYEEDFGEKLPKNADPYMVFGMIDAINYSTIPVGSKENRNEIIKACVDQYIDALEADDEEVLYTDNGIPKKREVPSIVYERRYNNKFFIRGKSLEKRVMPYMKYLSYRDVEHGGVIDGIDTRNFLEKIGDFITGMKKQFEKSRRRNISMGIRPEKLGFSEIIESDNNSEYTKKIREKIEKADASQGEQVQNKSSEDKKVGKVPDKSSEKINRANENEEEPVR